MKKIFCILLYLILCSVTSGRSYCSALFRINKPKDILDLNVISDKKNVIPVVIIGGGPAGLTAGMYSTRAGMYTLVFTGDKPGGQLIDSEAVENWPGVEKKYGADIMETLENQVQRFGAILIDGSVTHVEFTEWPFKITTDSGTFFHAMAVIIATGASPRKTGVPGEREHWGHGVSSCANCDAHFFKGKDVVIVGGGDAAVGEAILLSPHVNSVKILVRKNRMRSAKRVKDQLDEYDNVSVVFNVELLEILGDGKTVTGIKLYDTVTGEASEEPIDGVFLAIGQNPNTALFENDLQVNKLGYVLTDTAQRTSREGVYAAGDVVDEKYRQAVVAAADGCKAALEAVEWLRDNGLTELALKRLKGLFYKHEVTISENME